MDPFYVREEMGEMDDAVFAFKEGRRWSLLKTKSPAYVLGWRVGYITGRTWPEISALDEYPLVPDPYDDGLADGLDTAEHVNMSETGELL